ncbi:MAG: hypothetical protein V3U07_04390 [Nitrospirales bacterium]
MTFPTSRSWIWVFWILSLHLLEVKSFPPALAHDGRMEQPLNLLQQHRTKILQLSSDEEALAFHQSIVQHQQPNPRKSRKMPIPNGSLTPPGEIQDTITTLWAALAATAYSQDLRQSPVTPPTLRPSKEISLSEAQLEWILSKPPLKGLKAVVEIQAQLAAWNKRVTVSLPPKNEYPDFASYYDQTFSNWDTRQWLNLFEEEGLQGIEARLHEYWQQPDRPASQPTIPESTKQTYTHHYVETRLLPIFQAYLLSHTVQAEAQVYDIAWENWKRIQQWQQQEQTTLALTRLCGTWKWIVHNHQNHGDHKMTMTFSPPGQASPSQLAPTTVIIQGNTVYLKWTFAQGIQEDSLLLSNHDTHLEGTFRNSLGPHGSISGKRLSDCQF